MDRSNFLHALGSAVRRCRTGPDCFDRELKAALDVGLIAPTQLNEDRRGLMEGIKYFSELPDIGGAHFETHLGEYYLESRAKEEAAWENYRLLSTSAKAAV